jgi:hypothetical protein
MTIKGSPGKTFGQGSDEFGGGLVVWDGIKKIVRYPFGATITDTLAGGDAIVTGMPIKFDKVAKTATLCKCFRVYEAITGNYTQVKVNKWTSLPTVSATDVLMKCPSTQTGTGTGVTVSAVDSANEDHDILTVSTAAFGDLAEGDILVYAVAAGAGEDQLVIPTDFIGDNVYIAAEDIASGKVVCNDIVFEGSVMKHRLPPYPTYMELPEVSGQRYMFNEE